MSEEDFPVGSIVDLINYNLTVEPLGRIRASKILWILYRIDEDDLPDFEVKQPAVAVMDANVSEDAT